MGGAAWPPCTKGGRSSTAGTETARFPGVADALELLQDGTVVDGELVVLDADGHPDFNSLMRRQGAPCPLAFDLLCVGDRDLCAEPIEDRKGRLTDLVSGMTVRVVQNTDGIIGEVEALFDVVRPA